MEPLFQIRIGCNSLNRFDGEIRVVSDMTRKIIGRQLVLRIQAIRLQILGLLRQVRPESCGQRAIAPVPKRRPE